jgi:hypothetical protein
MSLYDKLDRENRCWNCHEKMISRIDPILGKVWDCVNARCIYYGTPLIGTINIDDPERIIAVMDKVKKGEVKPDRPFEI